MRKLAIAFFVCLVLLLCSCNAQSTTQQVDTQALAKALTEEISGDEEYLAYSYEDITYFPFFRNNAEIAIFYSRASEDIGELGVIRAKAEDAEALEKTVQEYLSAQKREKSAFLRNYAPNELSKLDNAEVRRYGNYIIFTVLDLDESANVFQKADELLR